jgi:hypothetical protein
MTPFGRIAAWIAHPDPRVAACNRIALIVASNQPFYPLFVAGLVGGDAQAACWTWLSTPFFLAVPALARRHAVGGRVLLVLAGIANTLISTKAFGTASAVEWFLLPCGLIALLALRRSEVRWSLPLLALALASLLLHGHYGPPWGRFSPAEQVHFANLNRWSVVTLSLFVLWQLGNAIRSAARSAASTHRPPLPQTW